MKTNPALSALRHHVTGAIARGEAKAITEVPATPRPSHTPGPWTALIEGEALHGSETHLVAAGPHCMAVAEVPMSAYASTSGCRGKTTITAAQGRANARLIASAPELLEALAGCADALREAGKDFAQANKLAVRPNLYELHERSARAAIAKARG